MRASRKTWMKGTSGLLVIGLVVACTVDSLDLEGKSCPCLADFECDVTANRCVPRGSSNLDAGGTNGENDGGAPPTDAGAEAEAGRFCLSLSPAPTFCADFDSDASPLDGLDAPSFSGATITIDDSEAVSRPSSLAIAIPALAPSGSAGGFIEREIPLATTELTVECDVRFEAEPASQRIDLVFITAAAPFGTYELRFIVKKDGATVYESTPLEDGGIEIRGGDLQRTLTLDSWTHLRMRVSTSPTSSSVDTQLDRNSVGKSELLFHQNTTPLKVVVGVNYVSVPPSLGSPFQVRLDNLILDSR